MASTIQVDKIQDTGGNTILQSDGSGTATATLPVGFGGTGAATLAAAGLSYTPAFGVTLSGSQSIPDGTFTKITWDTEAWDTDAAFASNKFTVPSDKAGKYFFTVIGYTDGQDDGEHFVLSFYKNGARLYREVGWTSPAADAGMRSMASVTLDLAVSDYVEVYAYQNEGSARDLSSTYSQFSGHKLIGV